MRIGRYRFSPALVPTLVTAALLPLLTGLGMWQLGRAEEKRGIEQTVARRIKAPPLEIDAERWSAIHLGTDASALAYRRVTMSGRFDGGRQYLLDNQTRNGVAGFQVLTAFMPGAAAGGVLVNRGWVPLGERRDRPPALPVPSTQLRLSGAFDGPRKSPPLLGSSGYEQPQWPITASPGDAAGPRYVGRFRARVEALLRHFRRTAPGVRVPVVRPGDGAGTHLHPG
jgi:surfeit locus 1 family protein